MLVSYEWLKEYVDITEGPEELAEIITRAGVEIGGIDYPAQDVSGVVVAEVLTCDNHPDSDHLHVCTVTTDGQNRIGVVCGAPNVAAGQKVCFAQVGATLPGGVTIGQAELRGVSSSGMICSMQELGVSDDLVAPDDKDGIRVLPADAPLGEDACTYLGLRDAIFDVDLTPNRSDCMSVYNLAREISALLEKPVRPLDVSHTPSDQSINGEVTVSVEAPDLCERYVGTLIRGLTDGRSPLWMEHRLQAAGVRPISFLVDVTNYVMLETGQPLHAFDAKEIAGGEVIVRRAHEGESIVTLDGKNRDLNAEMLLITDKERAIGIAGVMGGENTEIRPETKTVFLESAWFNPRNVRRTSLALGLRSEASIRNEKTLSIDMTMLASHRAATLMARYGGGQVAGDQIDIYPHVRTPKQVTMRYATCNALLGTDISPSFMVDVLRRLHFEVVEETTEMVTVVAPDWRPDIAIEEDLIEEVARLYGYDNIPESLPYGATHAGVLTEVQRLRRIMTKHLAARGLHEVLNYSFTRESIFDELTLPADVPHRKAVKIDNPLSAELSIMRTERVSALLDNVAANMRQGARDVAIFELAAVFLGGPEVDAKTLANEEEHLAIALWGTPESGWSDKTTPYDFYTLKGIIEDLCAHLFLPSLTWEPLTDLPTWHPGRSAAVYMDGEYLGHVGEVHPMVLKNWNIDGSVYAAELDLTPIFKRGLAVHAAQAPVRYPAVARDLALVVPDSVSQSSLATLIRENGGAYLTRLHLFDVYSGSHLPEGEKSLGYHLVFQSPHETLTDKAVDDAIAAIVAAAQKECGAYLRQ